MRISKSAVFGLLPVAGLLFASVSGGKTITAYAQTTPGIPDGSLMGDCNTGQQIGVEADGYHTNSDGSHTRVSACKAITARNGAGFSVGTTSSSCNNADVHRVTVYAVGGLSQKADYSDGWVTDFNSGANTSSVLFPDPVGVYRGTCAGGDVADAVQGWSFGS
jgi:hypothetical protein